MIIVVGTSVRDVLVEVRGVPLAVVVEGRADVVVAAVLVFGGAVSAVKNMVACVRKHGGMLVRI